MTGKSLTSSKVTAHLPSSTQKRFDVSVLKNKIHAHMKKTKELMEFSVGYSSCCHRMWSGVRTQWMMLGKVYNVNELASLTSTRMERASSSFLVRLLVLHPATEPEQRNNLVNGKVGGLSRVRRKLHGHTHTHTHTHTRTHAREHTHTLQHGNANDHTYMKRCSRLCLTTKHNLQVFWEQK